MKRGDVREDAAAIVVTPKGLEPGQRSARTSTISRFCNDHTALRGGFIPVDPR
jgi:hypothetical protein